MIHAFYVYVYIFFSVFFAHGDSVVNFCQYFYNFIRIE
jgi:hypothetical protein